MRPYDTSTVHMTRDDTSKARCVMPQVRSSARLTSCMTHMTRFYLLHVARGRAHTELSGGAS